jgi:hypothetical protein
MDAHGDVLYNTAHISSYQTNIESSALSVEIRPRAE